MRTTALLFVAAIVLTGQTPTTAPASGSVRHLVYQFGYNTKVASQGTGTGTTTIDILGSAPDGGVMVDGTDYWWNTARPRATNTCELHPNGGVSCSQRPYAISPIQLTIFPLLARGYFKPLSAGPKSNWSLSYKIYAAVLPGASGSAGEPNTWDCSYAVHGNGPIAGAAPLVLVVSTGKLVQEGGRYQSADDKLRIAYDPAAKIPVLVNDVRAHLPQRSVYNKDLVELKLVKDSLAGK
ncbi:MAG: hypothetical protein JOY69_09035 [Candidatus Eremiobacteraeota bacterium]|nr:hypothetical protein [Candidatus Eremiobacteraeota bacterium]